MHECAFICVISGEAPVRELTARRCPIQSGNATDPMLLTLLPSPPHPPNHTHAHIAMELTAPIAH